MTWVAIQAAAGCGKTTEIVRRYLELLDQGIAVEDIIAITFTRKAAGELTSRIHAELSARDGSAAHLAALPNAPIGTTDSFVRRVLEAHIGWAEVPCPDGSHAPLDRPLHPQNSLREALTWAAAHRLRGPRSADLDLLVQTFGLGETERQLRPLDPFDRRPLASAPALQAACERALGRAGSRGVAHTWLNMGSARLALSDLSASLGDRPDRRAQSEAVALARERLRVEVGTLALRRAASRGELDHDALTAAATRLFHNPPPRLHGRYRALLVDEAQDANPRQLDLYHAIADRPGPEPMQAIAVGDLRQSIYLFRNAEPDGFGALIRESAKHSDAPQLTTHYRAHPQLHSATHALFEALQGPLHERRLDPLDPASHVRVAAAPRGQALSASHHPDPRPVWVVRAPESDTEEQANLRALQAFWSRLQDAWQEPGHESDTAVVLAPTWRLCQQACRHLQDWAGDPTAAWVEGGADIVSPRVSDDVQHWLRALEDPGDHWAWLAVLKHPTIGLTDQALVYLRRGEGLIGIQPRPDTPLSAVLSANGVTAPLEESDQRALKRALPVLRAAVDDFRHENPARVLDRALDALDWRSVLAAGPGGEKDLAGLDVLLDLLRSRTVDGQGPSEIAEALKRVQDLEISRLSVDRPPQGVTCTTVFRAKGLDWDHVCVWSPGRPARTRVRHPEPRGVWVRIDGEDHRLGGFNWRPERALVPEPDPTARLAIHLAQRRQTSECARMAYVALTRARRSVTVATADTVRGAHTLQSPLIAAFRGVEHPGVAQVIWDQPAPVASPPRGAVEWLTAAPPARPVLAPPRVRRPPSSLAQHLDPTSVRAMAQRVAETAELSVGLQACHPRCPEEASPTEWGDLAHAWLAHWAFGAPPEPDAIQAWVEARFERPPSCASDWLASISDRVRRPHCPMHALISAPEHQTYREVPLIGCRSGDLHTWSSGRIDLLVETPQGWVILDFKAGEDAPSTRDDCLERGHLVHHVPQLEAYRDMLNHQGRPVVGLGLWYVRSGTSVFWT